MSTLASLRAELDAAVASCPVAELPELVAACAATQARAIARLATPVPVQPMEPGVHLIGATAMSAAIGMSVFWVREQAAQNRIPCHRAGRKLLFDPAEVIPAVKAMTASPATRKDGAQDRRSWVQRQKKRCANGHFDQRMSAEDQEDAHRSVQEHPK